MFKYQLAPFRPNHLLTDFRHLQVNRVKTLRGNEVFVLVAITIEHERHSHRRIRRNALRCHLVLGKHVFIRFGIGQVDIRPIIGNGIDLHRPRAIGIGQIPAERQIAAFRQIASNVVTHHARVFVGEA